MISENTKVGNNTEDWNNAGGLLISKTGYEFLKEAQENCRSTSLISVLRKLLDQKDIQQNICNLEGNGKLTISQLGFVNSK